MLIIKIIGQHFSLGKIKEKVTVFEDNQKVADTNWEKMLTFFTTASEQDQKAQKNDLNDSSTAMRCNPAAENKV